MGFTEVGVLAFGVRVESDTLQLWLDAQPSAWRAEYDGILHGAEPLEVLNSEGWGATLLVLRCTLCKVARDCIVEAHMPPCNPAARFHAAIAEHPGLAACLAGATPQWCLAVALV
jgi:hypothetical protein